MLSLGVGLVLYKLVVKVLVVPIDEVLVVEQELGQGKIELEVEVQLVV